MMTTSRLRRKVARRTRVLSSRSSSPEATTDRYPQSYSIFDNLCGQRFLQQLPCAGVFEHSFANKFELPLEMIAHD